MLCASPQLIAACRVLHRFIHKEFQPVLALEYMIKVFLQEKAPQSERTAGLFLFLFIF